MPTLSNKFAKLYINGMPKQSNAVYNFSLRISIPKDKNLDDALKLVGPVRSLLETSMNADTYIYQLEDSHLTKTQEERDSLEHDHNLHFQAFLKVKTKVRAGALIKILNEDEHIGKFSKNLTPASNSGKAALRDYCMKGASQVAGPWADKAIYLGADLITEQLMSAPQKKLLKFLVACDPVVHSKRQIIWVYDPMGGSGKSAFKKYCQFHKKWVGFTYASSKDILFLVSKFPNKRVYFFNLSKTRTADVSENELYCALEAIKDGDFTSTKYEPKTVLMNPCHVVVFANHLPKASLMTRDRLKVLKWNPLPREVIADSFEFDWSCDGQEEMTIEQVRKENEASEEPPRKKRKLNTESNNNSGNYWIYKSPLSTEYKAPMNQEE